MNVVLVCNHELKVGQLEFFKKTCSKIIIRGNQGFDFGGYKDAIMHLKSTASCSRLIIMNDSVFFSKFGLEGMVQRLLGPEDVVASYENWIDNEHHHIQSFCLSVSGYVFKTKNFSEFWENYIPINNRVYAIECGEKKLSRAILNDARDSHVIYSVASLYEKLRQLDDPLNEQLFLLPFPWRDNILRICENRSNNFMAMKVSELINVTSPIHSGAYYFPALLQSPLFKKDLVYRHRFEFWEVETWANHLMRKEDAEEYLAILRKKGDKHVLSKSDQSKYNLGIK